MHFVYLHNSVSSVSDDLPEHVNLLYIATVEHGDIDTTHASDLKQLLHAHAHTFAKSSSDLGYSTILQHDIDTQDAVPIRQQPRKPPLSAREEEDKILNEMLETGVIRPSTSPWASPVCLVKKPDGSYRFRIDYRKVNAVSVSDAYPTPNIIWTILSSSQIRKQSFCNT